MEGGKEERETTPPPPRGPQGAGPGRRAREERSPEPRDGVVACEAPGFTRRERTPNRALSLARARFHGIRRSARTDRGTGVGRRRPSPISESTYCVPWLLSFAVSLSPARNQKLGLSGVPSLTRLLAPPPALSPCRFHVLASCRSQFLAAAGKKRERYISDGKVGSLARSPGGGESRACSLGLVGARGERDEERDGTMTAMRLVGNGLAKR